MKVYTIGFTKKNAEQFFTCLDQPGLIRLIDIRLNNVSQLAGFTKRDDLKFFLSRINRIEYLHRLDMAPTKELLDEYKKNGEDWGLYQTRFLKLISERGIEKQINRTIIDGACLLCSESTPDYCHRRLVAEYLRKYFDNIEINHL